MSAFAEVKTGVRGGKGGWKGKEEAEKSGEGSGANTSEAERWVGGCRSERRRRWREKSESENGGGPR